MGKIETKFFFVFRNFPNRCNCDEGLCGPECNLENPCISNEVCMNDGICIDNCNEEPDYMCNCTSEYMGKNCTLMVRTHQV